jgi:hypothetical protein
MRRAQAILVLVAAVGLMWMHSLAPADPAAAGKPASTAVVQAGHVDGHGAPTDGGHREGLGTAHLCLAVLAVGAGLLLAARTLLRVTRPYAAGAETPGPIARRATWSLPPPDLVSALSISRT